MHPPTIVFQLSPRPRRLRQLFHLSLSVSAQRELDVIHRRTTRTGKEPKDPAYIDTLASVNSPA